MKIILEQTDLDTALSNYVATLGMDLTGKKVVIDFTAGRGPNGNSATVTITNTTATEDDEVLDTEKKEKTPAKKVVKKTTKKVTKKATGKSPAEKLVETAETDEAPVGESGIVDPFADSTNIF